MTKHAVGPLFAALLALTSCAHGSPQAAPASSASQGVRVTLASGRCYINRSTEQFPTMANDDRTRVDVELEVVNDADRVVEVELDRLRLDDRAAGQALPPLQSGTVSLSPGETKAVALAFEADDGRGCRRGLALTPDPAVTVDGQNLGLAPLPLRPRR